MEKEIQQFDQFQSIYEKAEVWSTNLIFQYPVLELEILADEKNNDKVMEYVDLKNQVQELAETVEKLN